MTVLLIILGVILAVILIIAVLLHFSVKIFIEANKTRLSINIKYFGFKLYSLSLPDKNKEDRDEKNPPEDMPENKPDEPEIELTDLTLSDSTDEAEREEIIKKIEESAESQSPRKGSVKPAEPEDKDKNNNEEKPEEDDEEKSSLLDLWNEYKQYIPAGKKAFRKLLKLIRFYDLSLDLTVGNDDAFKAGKNFGSVNAAVYSVIGLLCCIFSVKINHTSIKCDFEHKTFDVNFSTAVYIRPSAVIALALYIGYYYLKIRKSMKKLENNSDEKESST